LWDSPAFTRVTLDPAAALSSAAMARVRGRASLGSVAGHLRPPTGARVN
jgi:hypothetical protein